MSADSVAEWAIDIWGGHEHYGAHIRVKRGFGQMSEPRLTAGGMGGAIRPPFFFAFLTLSDAIFRSLNSL